MSYSNHALKNWVWMCYTYINNYKHDCTDDRAMCVWPRRSFIGDCIHPLDEWGRALEDTEVANDEVSTHFNRGYDHVVTLAQQSQISLSPNLILLNSCSMCSVCNGSSLLHNVQHLKGRGLFHGLTAIRLEASAHYRTQFGTMLILLPTSCRCQRLLKIGD